MRVLIIDKMLSVLKMVCIFSVKTIKNIFVPQLNYCPKHFRYNEMHTI